MANSFNETPLHILSQACCYDDVDQIKIATLLCDNGASLSLTIPDKVYNQTRQEYEKELQIYWKENYDKKLKKNTFSDCLNIFNNNFSFSHNQNGYTPLYESLRTHKLALARFLIKKNSPIDSDKKILHSSLAILLSAFNDSCESKKINEEEIKMIQLLIKNGASLNQEKILIAALKAQSPECINILINAGMFNSQNIINLCKQEPILKALLAILTHNFTYTNFKDRLSLAVLDRCGVISSEIKQELAQIKVRPK